MSRVLFVVAGMQRSGTTLIANRLSELTKLVYVHEPFNPLYGVLIDDQLRLAAHRNPVLTGKYLRSWKWNTVKRAKLLSRPRHISRISGTLGYDIFLKCPFWYVYHEKIELDVPKFFMFKGIDYFLRSNLSRGFTFRELIDETIDDEELRRIGSSAVHDETVVITIYNYLARRGLADSNVFFLHHESGNVARAMNVLREKTDIESAHTADIFTRRLCQWGRGMMKTGTDFKARPSLRSETPAIPAEADAIYQEALWLERLMKEKMEKHTSI